MVVEPGEIWWANLPEPFGSGPGFRRPILIVQAEFLNQTKLNTVIAVALTTNLDLAEMPGNVCAKQTSKRLTERINS